MLDHCDETYHSLKYCIGVLSWLLYQIIAIKTKQLCYSNNFALQAKHCQFLTIVNSWIQVYLCAKNIPTIVFWSSQLFGKDPCLSILTSSSINVSLCTLSSAIRDLRKLTLKKIGQIGQKGGQKQRKLHICIFCTEKSSQQSNVTRTKYHIS